MRHQCVDTDRTPIESFLVSNSKSHHRNEDDEASSGRDEVNCRIHFGASLLDATTLVPSYKYKSSHVAHQGEYGIKSQQKSTVFAKKGGGTLEIAIGACCERGSL